MIFLIVAAAAIGVAVLRGGSLERLASVRFAAIGALLPAVALKVLLNPMVLPGDWAHRLAQTGPLGVPFGGFIYLASLACALVFLAANWRHSGFPLVAAGLALNLLVIAANAGHMPGDPTQLARAGLLEGMLSEASQGTWSPFGVMKPDSPLWFLGDIMFVPMPFREPMIASVGDCVIALGVFGFFNPVDWPRLLRRASGRSRAAA